MKRCDSCGRRVPASQMGFCRACGLEHLCERCRREQVAAGCPPGMRWECAAFAERPADPPEEGGWS